MNISLLEAVPDLVPDRHRMAEQQSLRDNRQKSFSLFLIYLKMMINEAMVVTTPCRQYRTPSMPLR